MNCRVGEAGSARATHRSMRRWWVAPTSTRLHSTPEATHAPTQLPGAEPDRGDGLHRAGDRAGPEGARQGRRRAGDRRQPVPQHAARQARRASGRSRRTRRATARAWGSPSSARRPPGSSRPSSATRCRPRTSWSARGPSRSSSSSPRRCSTRATASWSSARSSRPTCPTSSAEATRAVLVPLAGRAAVPPIRRGRPALPGDRPEAAGDLPELAAQPDRRRGHPRGPGRDRRRGPRHRPDGLLRRAVLPHGLGRPARVDPGRAGDARAHRGGLHVQQVVQHERLADRLRGGGARRWSTRSAS